MSDLEQLKKKVDEFFRDTSKAIDETKMDLRDLADHIEILIDSLD